MGDAVLYTGFDVGGPGFRPTNTTESGSLSAVTRTFDILHSCLVTGYGVGENAKPGQGWVLVHADLPHGFTLRAPDGVYYVFSRGPNIPSTGPSQGAHGCQFFMAESLSAPYTYPPTGPGVRSGDYAASNPGATDRHWVCFSNSSNPENKWFLIARGSQVIFARDSIVWEAPVGSSPGGASEMSGAMFFMGNVLLNNPTAPRSGPQCSIVQGGVIQANTATGPSSMYGNAMGDQGLINANNDQPTTSTAGHTRLRDFITGVVESGTLTRITCNPVKHTFVGVSRALMPAFPAPLRLDRVDVWITGVGSVGLVPGVFHGGRSCHYRTMDLLVALGRGPSITECLTPVMIEGEPFHVIPTGYGSVFVSLLEKYWT